MRDGFRAVQAEIAARIAQQVVRAEQQRVRIGGRDADGQSNAVAIADGFAQRKRYRSAGYGFLLLGYGGLHKFGGFGQDFVGVFAEEIEKTQLVARRSGRNGGKNQHGGGNQYAGAEFGTFHGQNLPFFQIGTAGCGLCVQIAERVLNAGAEAIVRPGKRPAKLILHRFHGTDLRSYSLARAAAFSAPAALCAGGF